jgi:hypothetical protein
MFKYEKRDTMDRNIERKKLRLFSIPLIGRANAHSAREVGEGQTDF